MTSILTRGNEVRVNTTTLDSQLDQKITTLSDGSYVIVWQSFAQDGSVGGIYSQRYDSNGNKIGAETLINTTTSGIQNAPSIAALETGGYVICWTGNGSQVGQVDSSGVFYKLYDVDGNAVGNETLVNSTTASTQDRPVVSGTAGGGFAITWTSFAQDTAASNGVYMRLFTEGGTAQTAEIAVNVTTSGNQLSRSVTTLSDGSIIVAWTDDTLDGSGIGVFMRRFSAAGTALTGEALVNTTTASNQTLPVVKSLPNGGYIVVWSGNGSQTGNIDNFGVFFQIYDANNNKVGGETLVNSFTLDGQDFPSMAVLTDGGFVIVWPSFNQDGSSFGAFGQRFDENGAKIGPEFQINSYTVNGQDKPVVSALNDGGFVVTWQSELQDGSGLGVYSRRYGAATTLTGTQYLYGTIDSDRLDGGIGGDFMYGGKGSDTYIVSSSNDVVSENANEGNDFIEASISYSLDGTNVENLTLTGMDNLSGVGSSANNRLIGNEGDNSLEGLEGNDKLYGGDGNDNLTGDFGNDTLYGENGNDEIDGLEDNDLIYGGFGQDTLNGGLGNDTVYGGDDNDLIYASEGADTLLGEGGIDTIDASILSAGIYINLAAGRARFQNTNTYLSGFENITGSAFNDTLYGDSGNNVIFGDNGADIMAGGAGDDVYFYDDSGDRANEADGQGDDQLFSSVNVNLTGRYIETVFLTGNDNTSIFCNEKATELWGNSGNNLLTSGLGPTLCLVALVTIHILSMTLGIWSQKIPQRARMPLKPLSPTA